MIKKIYVAGASGELDRAERWMNCLKDSGIEVTSTWPEVIKTTGSLNPAEASMLQRRQWSEVDLAEIDEADYLWFLSPEKLTSGAWVELGYAYARQKPIYGSHVAGELPHNSIFTGLAKVWADDLSIFNLLKEIYAPK